MILKKYLFIFTFICSLYIALDLELIAKNLSKPVYLCSPNSQNELYIVEQKGQIIKINLNGKKETFLDIRSKVKNPTFPGDERGLLGMAFHPEYKNNGYFFLNYIDNNENSIISKIKYNHITKEFSESILIKLKQPYSNHNGGQLEFGSDGYLYIAFGDGGAADDPHNNAQTLTNFFGKILRIDINDRFYKIPPDNPFINTENAKKEIWAYGLRNPWRFSFDLSNNLIIIADVGQNSWEEINMQNSSLGGLNYGWNIKEGKHVYTENTQQVTIIDPILEYPSNANYARTLTKINQSIDVIGCSVTGGYVYTKKDIPDIQNCYLFGDYCTGRIWTLKDFNSSNYKIKDITEELTKNLKKQLYISSFGIDSKDNLYIIDHSGSIYKIIN